MSRKYEKQITVPKTRTPKCIIWVLGKMHGNKGYIVQDEEGCHSPYINRKKKSFENFAALRYLNTAKKLESIRQEIIALECERDSVAEKLKHLPEIQPETEDMTVREKRERKKAVDEQLALQSRLHEIGTDIAVKKSQIAHDEFYMEEALQAKKRKTEHLTTIYLQGAGKSLTGDASVRIPVTDPVALRLYEKRLKNGQESSILKMDSEAF